MNTAISFDAADLDTETPIGIDVATREFLRAKFRYSNDKIHHCVCPNQDAFELFLKYANNDGVEPQQCRSINPQNFEFHDVSIFFRYDPAIIKNALARKSFNKNLYSIVGIAHACASSGINSLIARYIGAPIYPWDALICPSKSIRSAIQSLLKTHQDMVYSQFGIKAECPLQLPIIPIGVDTQKFDNNKNLGRRAAIRNILGTSDDTIVILYVGRLNFISKSNLLPLALSAKEVGIQTNKKIELLFYGYFADKLNEEAFYETLNTVCPEIKFYLVKNGDKRFPDGVWACADIFCSMSDNIQESFGITPLEAMASSIPVLVSDWDGYRETVKNGIDGFTIPTYMPPPGNGKDIADLYHREKISYGDYLGATSQSTVIDIVQLTQKLSVLVSNKDLRLKMGNLGKLRMQKEYDWCHIISAYETLWLELERERQTSLGKSSPVVPSDYKKTHPDPFFIFKEFATCSITLSGKISLSITDWEQTLKRIGLKMSLILPTTLIPLDDLPILLGEIEKQETTPIKILIDRLPVYDNIKLLRTIAWLAKIGICRYIP